MSKSQVEELAITAANYERKMRSLRRHITSISKIDKDTLRGDGLALFKAQLGSAEEYWAEFKSVWDERDDLSAKLGDSDTFPNDQWNAFYDQLKDAIITARSILISVEEHPSPHDRTSISQANASMVNSCKPSLPSISIPSFHGDLLKWASFRDTFVSMVHNQTSLSDIEKFHYLIGALKGEAASLVARFPVEENSYLQAWNKVLKTYDNPRVLASLLIHRIVDCGTKRAKGEQQAFDLFLTNVADSIESFRALKLENPCDFLLATLALRALDHKTREQFELSLKTSTVSPTADDIIQFVRQRKTALKMSREIGSRSPSPSDSSPNYSKPFSDRRYPSRASPRYKSVSLHSAHEASVNTEPPANSSYQGRSSDSTCSPTRCLYCQKMHPIYRCTEFLRLPASRRAVLVKSYRACFNCLSRNHRVGDCPSRFRCRHCKRKHHTLVHEENTKSEPSSSEEDNVAASTQEDPQSFSGFGSAFPHLLRPREPSCWAQ